MTEKKNVNFQPAKNWSFFAMQAQISLKFKFEIIRFSDAQILKLHSLLGDNFIM